jgi:hypothetical protein
MSRQIITQGGKAAFVVIPIEALQVQPDLLEPSGS